MSKLTDADVKDARPGAKLKKFTDGDGLFLLVTPRGGKWWRFRYRFEGKEKLISLVTYPNISLAESRILRDKAHQLLKQGKDPSAVRKIEKAERVRKSITKNIKTAINKIKADDRELATFLSKCIHTGNSFHYTPDRTVNWDIKK